MKFSLSLLMAICLALIAPKPWAEVPVYTVKVLEKRATERRNFVQGLEIDGDRLLVSSGGYGDSAVRIYQWPEMTLLQERALPSRFFGEGLTRVDDRLYVLTWRARRMLVLHAETLEPLGQGALPGEGWGITHHGGRIWFSDGTDQLYTADLHGDGKLERMTVTRDGRPVKRLNELEWVNGEIWANVWQSDTMVRINPESGEVVGVIDLSGLLAKEDRLRDTDVLNGIAVDAAKGDIWVTGKRWPWLFRITLELQETGPHITAEDR